MGSLLNIKELHAKAGEKEILKGLSLRIQPGEVHVVMGPNGAGKSTLANVIFNSPEYTKTSGTIEWKGEDISTEPVNVISDKGIFMSFQSPQEIPGITNYEFLKYIKGKKTGEPVRAFAFRRQLQAYMQELNMNPQLLERGFNEGFSGGEKKKNEILQMLVINPELAVLDETDSGLDVDALRIVNKGIQMYHKGENALLIITHNRHILKDLRIDCVHVLMDGRIVKTGGEPLISEIQKYGFEPFREGGHEK